MRTTRRTESFNTTVIRVNFNCDKVVVEDHLRNNVIENVNVSE